MPHHELKLLALDLGTTTGYCNGKVSGTQTFDLKRGESPGMRFLRLHAWLNEIYQLMGGIDVIAYEQAHHRGGHATQCALGMVTHVLSFAAEKNIQTSSIHSATLKKWATGNGRANKEAMIARANMYGFDVADDNEADACLIWAFYIGGSMGLR